MSSEPSDALAQPPRVIVDGLGVHALTRGTLLSLLDRWSSGSSATRRMYYTNAHVFNLASADPRLRATLNDADALICEGWAGIVGSRILGRPLPEQLATMDWIDEFLAAIAARGGSIYLVGDEPGVAIRCGREMQRRHPGLTIAGARHGYWDRDGEEDELLVDDVRRTGPDVLMVGMGTPIQERWIEDRRRNLDVPLILALGAMFRWYSGEERRAPRWMRQLHLEWLMRLLKHPVRHFRRYIVGNPWFLWRCVKQRVTLGPG